MKTRRKSYIGQTFGRWFVAGDAPDRDMRRYLVCTCQCGVTRTLILDHVVSGKSQSCGCLRKERQQNTRGSKRIPWKMSEIKAIEELYPTGGAIAVMRVLPNRTASSIKMKASYIGVKHNREKTAHAK